MHKHNEKPNVATTTWDLHHMINMNTKWIPIWPTQTHIHTHNFWPSWIWKNLHFSFLSYPKVQKSSVSLEANQHCSYGSWEIVGPALSIRWNNQKNCGAKHKTKEKECYVAISSTTWMTVLTRSSWLLLHIISLLQKPFQWIHVQSLLSDGARSPTCDAPSCHLGMEPLLGRSVVLILS